MTERIERAEIAGVVEIAQDEDGTMIAMISSNLVGLEMASRKWAETKIENKSYDSGIDDSPEEQKHGREQYLAPHTSVSLTKEMGYVCL